jgi:putative ABC transport system substrate-binding protein
MTTVKLLFKHLALVASACVALPSCATWGPLEQPGQPAMPSIEDPPARPGAKTVLIAMPESRDFAEARKGLVTEIKRDFNVTTLIVTPATTVEQLTAAIDKTAPVCLVLMNNSTLNLFQKFQSQPGARTIPPAVVLMTSFLEEARSRVKHVTGIAYEVPGVTAFINLRMVLTKPINRIGVVFRPPSARFVGRQKALAAREHIELVPIAVPVDVSADGLRTALRTLSDSKVDAVWMLNDNGLIRNGAFVAETWRTVLNDLKLPLVVGVPNLVDPAEPVGTLAAVPDHEALGLQAANLIFDLADNDWDVRNRAIELPLSVKTVVDVQQVRDHFGLKPDALDHIDRPLEPSQRRD